MGPDFLAWLGEQSEADYTVRMRVTTYPVMSAYAEVEAGTHALAGMSKSSSTTLAEPLSWVWLSP